MNEKAYHVTVFLPNGGHIHHYPEEVYRDEDVVTYRYQGNRIEWRNACIRVQKKVENGGESL